jgi:hypothetical protein
MKKSFLILTIPFLWILGCKKEEIMESFNFTFKDLSGTIVYERRELSQGSTHEYLQRIWFCGTKSQKCPKSFKFGLCPLVSNSGDRISYDNYGSWTVIDTNGANILYFHRSGGALTFLEKGGMAWSKDDSKLSLSISCPRSFHDTTNYILIFDSKNAALLDSFEINQLYWVSNLQWSNDSKRIYFSANASKSDFSSNNYNIWSINLSDYSLFNHTKGTEFEDRALVFDISPNDSMIVIGDGNGCKVAPFENGKIGTSLYSFLSDNLDFLRRYCAKWSPDSNYLIFMGIDGVYIIDKLKRKSLKFYDGCAPDW